jgi:hypothetical protein
MYTYVTASADLKMRFVTYQYTVAYWLKHYCISQKVAGSNPDEIIGYFHFTQSLQLHNVPGVDSASNRSQYKETSLG